MGPKLIVKFDLWKEYIFKIMIKLAKGKKDKSSIS